VLREANAETPIRLGTTVTDLEDGAAPRVRLSDGSTGSYDLVVGAAQQRPFAMSALTRARGAGTSVVRPRETEQADFGAVGEVAARVSRVVPTGSASRA
jgi:hypothetical protein